MMELSNKDIERLEKKGYRLEEFAVIEEGIVLLRNVDGYCYFLSRKVKKCEKY
jgi:Fe-S-cluster containining protein